MAVEVQKHLIDVHSLRTSILGIVVWNRINAVCGKVTSLFLLVVRSIV